MCSWFEYPLHMFQQLFIDVLCFEPNIFIQVSLSGAACLVVFVKTSVLVTATCSHFR